MCIRDRFRRTKIVRQLATLAACVCNVTAFKLTAMFPRLRFFLAAILLAAAQVAFSQNEKLQQRSDGVYEFRTQHDRDGIGKFYMGREIAHVMGHQAADWLERPEREEEEKTDLLVDLIKLKPGDAVADIEMCIRDRT